MFKMNYNGGLLGVIIDENINFNSRFLKEVSRIFPIVDKNDEITQIVITQLGSIYIDNISLTYLYNICAYFYKKKGIKCMVQKILYNRIDNTIKSYDADKYNFIEMNEIYVGKINYYTLYGENEFTHVVKGMTDYILSKSIVHNKNKIEEFLKTTIGEIFSNASYHNQIKEYYFFQDSSLIEGEIYFTVNVIDYGNTIIANVNKYFKENNIVEKTREKRIDWAIKQGNTTRIGSGGYGLSTLIQYLKNVNGKLIILSGNEIYELSPKSANTTNLEYASFPGTIVSFTVHLYDLDNYLEYDSDRNTIQTRSINLNDI